MPLLGRVSFRILHPDPFDFHLVNPSFNPLKLAADFVSRSEADQFEKTLQTLYPAMKIHRAYKGLFLISWFMGKKSILPLTEKIRPKFPELSNQVKKGFQGYFHPDHWLLKGRGGKLFRWARRTQVIGILNVTPDSFSDGGRFLEPSRAVEKALQMQQEGADWIDIGGESTRPGAKGVPASDEKKRVLPVIRSCVKALRIPISVDTYKAEVALAGVGEGAQMVNDIGALGLDPRMGKTLAKLGVPVILMHMKGKPRGMQKKPFYRDVMGEITAFFRQKIALAQECGIDENRLLIDPGFGFGKIPWHNIEITRRLWEFKVLGKPLVLGPSRKSTLGHLLGGASPDERVEGTAAAVTAAILKGADFVRVHDVKAMVRVVKIADAIRYDRGLKRP